MHRAFTYCLLLITVFYLHSCIRNIDSFPDEVSISPSLSLSIGTGVFNTEKDLLPVGLPEINIGENVPSWARYKVISIHDSVTFSISEIFDNVDSVRLIAFKVNIWNQFPAKAKLQVYFCDDTGIRLDSLWHDAPLDIAPGEFDSSGKLLKESYA
ncbi:MAG: hypothetical protein LBQ60_05120 [Bacteroidales bacterium]|jgi:hypothetical protein|nr:hypothetical protein [Bacteroidales bacterium]